MITSSITLEQAKKHLRVTHDIDDAYILELIPDSFALIEAELDRSLDDTICTTEVGMRNLRRAALLIISDLYVNREAQQEYQLHQNDTINRLLNKYRRVGV